MASSKGWSNDSLVSKPKYLKDPYKHMQLITNYAEWKERVLELGTNFETGRGRNSKTAPSNTKRKCT